MTALGDELPQRSSDDATVVSGFSIHAAAARPRKKVLIISPYFPPMNAPDLQRVRLSLPYYRANGWEPVVLAVRPDAAEGMMEPDLLTTLPPEVRVIRVAPLPRALSRALGVGNIGLRSWASLLWHGAQLLASERFDLVFFSTTQFIIFTLGPLWKRASGVPYILDFQDPWRTDYYERPGSRPPPGGWKYQFARLQAWALEGFAVKQASALMSVSPSYLQQLRARYPSVRALPSAVIRFGASAADLAYAAAAPEDGPHFDRSEGQIHLLYTGASGPVMPDSLTVLFDSVRIYREKHPTRARRLRFHFVGTSYAPRALARSSVMPVAASCGVADQVEEIPHRIGHLAALRWQQRADILLLPGSSDLAYSPSKIYPYFLSDRPILGLVLRDSVMEHLLDELSCAHLVRYRRDDPKTEAHAALEAFFELALQGFPAGSLPARNRVYFDQYYLAEKLTVQQAALFDRAIAARPNAQ